jgi:hypothetical protein
LEDTITTEQKIIRAKVGLLELAEQATSARRADWRREHPELFFYER